MDTDNLDDEALAATAYVWHARGRLGDRRAQRIACELDAELTRRIGSTLSQPAGLRFASPVLHVGTRPWWKIFWCKIGFKPWISEDRSKQGPM